MTLLRHFGVPALLLRQACRLLNAFFGKGRRHPYRRPVLRTLCFEDLEERSVPATFTVLNVLDSGVGSLRQAILDSNNSPGLDTITFSIGSGMKTILPTSSLPTITDPVFIDATTQPGFTGTPIIELDGHLAGAVANGLTISAGKSIVRDLVINRFAGNGIELDGGTNSLIEGNYIGTDVTGTLAKRNDGYGVALDNTFLNTVGGTSTGTRNLISGNGNGGVFVTGDAGMLVATQAGALLLDSQTGTVLATYAAGLQADAAIFGPDGTVYVANYSSNRILHYDASGTLLATIGVGDLSTPRDMAFAPNGNLCVTSGNDDVQEFTPTGTHLGQFSDGAGAGMSGIRGITFGPDGIAYETDFGHSRIYTFNGTTGAFLGYLATGSGGFEHIQFGPDGNLYVASQGNNAIDCFRTDGTPLGAFVSGTASPYGFAFDQSGDLEIPKASLGQVNVYDGTSGAFIKSLGAGLSSPMNLTQAPGNVIEGNLIGTDISGLAALPNLTGVLLLASNTMVGGTVAGAGNTIAFNSGDGIEIQQGSGNSIEGNALFANSGLGIDLEGYGVTSNTGSRDVSMPNFAMNFPVFTSASLSGTTLTVTGYVGSAPDKRFSGVRELRYSRPTAILMATARA